METVPHLLQLPEQMLHKKEEVEVVEVVVELSLPIPLETMDTSQFLKLWNSAYNSPSISRNLAAVSKTLRNGLPLNKLPSKRRRQLKNGNLARLFHSTSCQKTKKLHSALLRRLLRRKRRMKNLKCSSPEAHPQPLWSKILQNQASQNQRRKHNLFFTSLHFTHILVIFTICLF